VTTKLRHVPAVDDPSDPGPPEAADPDALWPLGDEVATALLGLLEVELRGRGLRWRVAARDTLEVGRTDAPWPGTHVQLGPLRERMRDCAKADWPELIEQYVSSLRGFDAAGPDPAPAVVDPAAVNTASSAAESVWERMRAPLRARILAADALDGAANGTLVRHAADGLLEAVVAETSTSTTGGELVSAGDALGWGVAEHEVFAAARANVRGCPRLEAERFTLDGTELLALFGPSHYAATHVLWLADYLDGAPGWDEANGALVVVPHRHLIAVHPIESAAVVAAAGTLLRFAARQYETCPGPISDQLYWWHGGELNRLPSDSVGETLQVFPSDRFAALLDRLRSAGDGGGS
jgi:hypothetical protein